ncbi:MAG: hypothetical protein DHS20C01_32970 [marine bacterium B5-7]|nr:MAG: hypothetical protein DHS20C01_32970 [marine bacterium B5-7]
MTKNDSSQDNLVEITPPSTFAYRKPSDDHKGQKEIVVLCKSPTMRGSVHVIRKGGGEHLHSHRTVDGFWMVISGRVRFYGDNNELFGEFGPMQGIMLPRNNRYRFECESEEDAEIIQVLHFESDSGFQRDNHEEPKWDRHNLKWFDGST